MVGKHVSVLEDRLGAQLLQRSTRRQSLTAIGQTFYKRCRVVLAEVEAAEATARESGITPRGRLRVSARVTSRRAGWCRSCPIMKRPRAPRTSCSPRPVHQRRRCAVSSVTWWAASENFQAPGGINQPEGHRSAST
jgi:hypothetical protein